MSRLMMVLMLAGGLSGVLVATESPLRDTPDGWTSHVEGGIPAPCGNKTNYPSCIGDTSKPHCDRTACQWVDNGTAPADYYCVSAWVIEVQDSYAQAGPSRGGLKNTSPAGTVYCEKTYQCNSTGTNNCFYDTVDNNYFCGNAGTTFWANTNPVASSVARRARDLNPLAKRYTDAHPRTAGRVNI